MKKKLYLRVQALVMVLLMILTTFVITPQQAKAETMIADDEDSQQVADDEDLILSAADYNSPQVSAEETDIVPADESSKIADEEVIKTDINPEESQSESIYDQADETDPSSVDEAMLESKEIVSDAVGLTQTEPAENMPEHDGQATEPNESLPEHDGQATEPIESLPEHKNQAIESTESTSENYSQATEPEAVKSDNANDDIESSVESVDSEQIAENIAEENINDQNPDITTRDLPEIENKVRNTTRAFTPEEYFRFDVATGTITKYIGPDQEVDIPSTIGGITVRKIGDNAFKVNSFTPDEYKRTRITIPDTVTEIGFCAFQNNLLTNITIPKKVTKIGDWAFFNNKLTSLSIPFGVTEIGGHAFSDNQLTSVTLSNSITVMGYSVFENNLLTSVTIPSGITKIENFMFSNNKLTSVTIPDNITSIGDDAFSHNLITGVTISDSVTTIGDYAFGDNKLSNVTIPGSVETLSGFNNNQLTSITIPNSVTEIGRDAFSHNKLTKIIIPNSVTDLKMKAFFNNQLTSVTIPESVTAVEDSAFKSNPLNTALIPDSIITLWYLYNNSDSWVYITLPSVAQILEHCFDPGVSVLRYIKAGSNIRRISDGKPIETLKMPIFVTGVIDDVNLNYLKFAYKGQNAYVDLSVTTGNSPALTGYAKSTTNVRNSPNGSVTGTILRGHKVSGTLVGNWVRFTYSGKTCYVYASLLQGTPIKVTTYIKANSIIRSAPNGSMITKLWRPLLVNGTLEGAWFRFIYEGYPAYVASSLTTTSNPPITGYAKSAINVRNAPGGSVIGTIPIGRQVKGVLVGNMVRFTYNNRTGYISASLLQATPVQVTRYIIANSIIRSAPNGSIIIRTWRPLLVSGTIEGAWLKFTYNSRTAYVAMSLTTTNNPAMTGYAKQKLYVRNTPNGSVVGTIPRGYKVSGVLVGNMVRFTYNGKTSYVYASLLQKDSV